MNRSVAIVTLLVATGLLSPAGVRAASSLWTLVASPLTATVGVQKVITLTGTNADPLASVISSNEIGCVYVDVPADFNITGASVTGSTAGDSWDVESIVNNRVTVSANSGGDRLKSFDSVTFRVTAMPTVTGSLAWNARAYRDQDCGGSGALVDVPPIVVVTGASTTPTPKPTPVMTPRPTTTPTPHPLPSLPLPSIPPPSGALGTPRPTPVGSVAGTGSSARPTPSPSTGRPRPSSSAAAIPASAGGAPPPSGGDGGVEAGRVVTPAVFRLPSGDGLDLGLGLGDLNLLSGFETWAVPAATVGGVGLLVVLFIGLQAGGTLIWVPAVRRLRGAKTSRRRRRRHAIG